MLESVIQALRQARTVLVFTGAGISTGSGIPDFRGASGAVEAPPTGLLRGFHGLRGEPHRALGLQMRRLRRVSGGPT